MKKPVIFILFFAVLCLFQSCCWYGDCGETNVNGTRNYKPIVVERSVFESSVKLVANKNIVKAGKIYIKDHLMLLNDVNKGFQIYDYSNASKPVKIAYIEIPGATDVAIKNDIIYINQAVDLVTLSYDNTTNKIKVLSRNKNIFPQKRSPEGFFNYTKENEVIIDWVSK